MILKAFLDNLPPSLLILLEKARDFALVPFFVGGATRDFLLKKEFSKDIDIEFHHDGEINDEDFLKLFMQFISYLKEDFEVVELGLHVYRISMDDFKVEFTLPRREIFRDGEYHHQNFEAIFSNFSIEESSKRRDFSINSIYFEYKNNDIIIHDPHGGRVDLENGILRECSTEFHKDPVRLLRAYRFKNKYGMEFTKSLKKELKKMSAENISPHYIKHEIGKSPIPWAFIENLFVDCPKDFPYFKFASEQNMVRALCDSISEEDHFERLLLSLSLDPYLADETKDLFFEKLSISTKKYPYFPKNNKNNLNNIIDSILLKSVIEVIDDENFEDLFDYYRRLISIIKKDKMLKIQVVEILKKLGLHKCFIKAFKKSDLKFDLTPYPEDKRAKAHLFFLLTESDSK